MDVKIKLNPKRSLGTYGYHDVMSSSQGKRRAALRKAATDLGWLKVLRRLNVLYVYNKTKNPKLARVFRDDRVYASSRHAATKFTKTKPL